MEPAAWVISICPETRWQNSDALLRSEVNRQTGHSQPPMATPLSDEGHYDRLVSCLPSIDVGLAAMVPSAMWATACNAEKSNCWCQPKKIHPNRRGAVRLDETTDHFNRCRSDLRLRAIEETGESLGEAWCESASLRRLVGVDALFGSVPEAATMIKLFRLHN